MNTSIYTCSAILVSGFIFVGMIPVVHAETIVNRVESYVSTGGQSGTAGADGRDGADGARGKDGTDGGSNGTASVHIESYVNGEKVIDVHKFETSSENASLRVRETHTSESESAVGLEAAALMDIHERALPHATNTAGFLALLSSIHLTLLSYVADIF